jgi:superfamily II DNA helicase RecQ
LVKVTSEECFNLEPYDWQIEVGAHLNKMTSPSSGVSPAPVFLNRHTGGGKSLVRDIFAASQGGVTWTISPMLSLAANQESSVNRNANQQTNHAIIPIHLDNYRNSKDQNAIFEQIKRLSKNSTTTVLLFSSPQAIQDSATYFEMFKLT